MITESGAVRLWILPMEVYGGFHKSTEAFFRYLADTKFPGVGPKGEGDTDSQRAQFIARIRERNSIAIMKGNSIILQRFRRECLGLAPDFREV